MRHRAPWALTLRFRWLGSTTSIAVPLTAPCAIGFWHVLRKALSAVLRRRTALSRQRPSALLLGDFGERGSSHSVFCFPGFPQRAKALHVLANRGGSLLDIRHRSHAFFLGQTLPIGARDTYRRWFSRFPAYHLSRSKLSGEQTSSILGSSGHTAISVHP
jgi:hypothetical protein